MRGTEVDLRALTERDAAAISGVVHGEVLLAFTEAMVGEDDDVLAQVRNTVIDVLGAAAMVDAAGVASNFERMVRIADATGIPLDDRMATLTKEVRDALHLERFVASKDS